VNASAYLKPVLLKRKGVAIGVWGGAGIGKSYQVTQLLQGLPCRSASLHATTPLSVLATTLPKPKKLATWAERTLARLGKGEAVETSNVIDALGATLAGLAPFVLHLEDIHEADPERATFIQDLAKVVLRMKGVGLVVTSRKETAEPFTAIKLGPLSQQHTKQLLEQELKSTLPNEALEFIYSKAAGNPLYTLEYLRYLTRQGFLWNDGRVWHWRKPEHTVMPVTVEALIEQFLIQAKAEPLQRYVLETKAFLPLTSTDEVWGKIARVNEQELEVTITELSQQGIFKEREFAHPLFREVTLNTLSPDRKQNLARRAINSLKDNPEQMVTFIDDAKLESEQALELLERITTTFEIAGKKLEASRCLERAVKYATGEAQGRLALRAAQLSFKAGDARTLALIQQAIQSLGETEETLQVLVEAYAMRGERSEVLAILSRFKYKTNKSWLIRQLFIVGAYDDMANLLETSLNIEELNENSIYHIAYFLMDKGQLSEALELVEQRLLRPALSISAKALLQDIRASVFHYQGNYQKADFLFSEVIELYKQANTVWDGAVNTLRNRALNRLQMGLYREVMPDFQEALGIYAERGRSVLYAETLGMMGDIYLELAEYDKALEVLTESLAIFERIQTQSYHVHLFSTLVNLYVEFPTSFSMVLAPKYAQSALTCAKELKSILYEATANLAASRAFHFTNHFTLALGYADESLQHAEEAKLTELIIEAQTARALALGSLGQQRESQQLLQTVSQLAFQHGMGLKVNKIGLELDRLNNDLESARTRMQWFQERGLLNGVNIAKRYFPELADVKEVATPAKSSVRLEVLGSLQVTLQKETTPIRGRKRQELLALLLEARISGRSEISRLTLLDTLYPDEDEFKAAASLKVVVHSLRETLGENAITTTNNGYALGECTSDAELFLQSGDTMLWRGLYLEGLESEDSTVRDSLYLALFEKVKDLLEDNPKEVARVGGLLLEADPYNTDYLKTYFTALRLSNNHGKLTRHYAEARTRLLEVNETLPDTWQGFLS
jgi:tetratricopeptide (TPR) repeat protein